MAISATPIAVEVPHVDRHPCNIPIRFAAQRSQEIREGKGQVFKRFDPSQYLDPNLYQEDRGERSWDEWDNDRKRDDDARDDQPWKQWDKDRETEAATESQPDPTLQSSIDRAVAGEVDAAYEERHDEEALPPVPPVDTAGEELPADAVAGGDERGESVAVGSDANFPGFPAVVSDDDDEVLPSIQGVAEDDTASSHTDDGGHGSDAARASQILMAALTPVEDSEPESEEPGPFGTAAASAPRASELRNEHVRPHMPSMSKRKSGKRALPPKPPVAAAGAARPSEWSASRTSSLETPPPKHDDDDTEDETLI